MSNTMLEKVHEVEVFSLEEQIIDRESKIKVYNSGLLEMWIEQGRDLLRLYNNIGGLPYTYYEPNNTEVIAVKGARELETKLNKAIARGTIYRYMAFALCPWIREIDLTMLVTFDQRTLEKMALLKKKDDFLLVLALGDWKEYLKVKDEEERARLIADSQRVGINYDVVHGDSMIKTLDAPHNIKCVITDPPYGMDFVSNRRTGKAKDIGIANDGNLDDALKVSKKVFENLYDKMDKDSSLFCFIGWREEPEFRNMISDIGFEINNSIIWNKKNHGTGDLEGSFAPKHERIIFATKGRPLLSKRLDDVLEGSDTRTEHPTAKPVDLIKQLIEVMTKPGDTIVDPFAGHGSTLIAIKEVGHRNMWGCEYDEFNYAEIKRWLNE